MRSTLHLMSAADYAARADGAAAEQVGRAAGARRALGGPGPRRRAAGRARAAARHAADVRRDPRGAAGAVSRRQRPRARLRGAHARAARHGARRDGDRWGFARVADVRARRRVARRAARRRPLPRRSATRYLGAFGPASAKDLERWSATSGAKAVLDGMRDRLEVFADERGRELFDLPDAPRPDAGVPAPARLLPEFDNLVLAHDDRSRVIADEHRPLVTTKNLRVKATFLVDGVVARDVDGRGQAQGRDADARAVRDGRAAGGRGARGRGGRAAGVPRAGGEGPRRRVRRSAVSSAHSRGSFVAKPC